MELSNERLYQFAVKHHLDGIKQAKSRHLLLKEFIKIMKNMTKEEYEKCTSLCIRHREYQKEELRILAIIVKDMKKYNDFCSGEFLTKDEEVPSYLEYIFDQAMNFANLEEFLAIKKESEEEKDFLELLEIYRAYYATEEEKEKYDNWMRQTNYLYRKTPLFLGYEAFQAYLLKKDNPNAVEEFIKRSYLKENFPIQRYIAKYLPFASKQELEEYKKVCSNVLLESRSTILLKKWYQWLTSIDIEEMPNYEQQFLKNENISSRLFRIILVSNKPCDEIAYQKLYQECLALEEKYQMINEKRKEKEMEQLILYLKNNQSYLFKGEPFSVLDFFSLTAFSYNEVRQDGYFGETMFRFFKPYQKLYSILLAVQPLDYQDKRPYFITKREDVSDINTLEIDGFYPLSEKEQQMIWNYIEKVVFPRPLNLKTYLEIAKELVGHPDFLQEYQVLEKNRK